MSAGIDETTTQSPSRPAEQADLLERVANGVLFLAILVAVLSIFGGVLALSKSEDGSHPDLGLGYGWIAAGVLFGATVTLLAVWAKTYAAVVRAQQS